MVNGKISVIITTYKATYRLREAIYSVINQTYDNFEICVVDDNQSESVDRIYTEKIMKEFSTDNRINYIKHSYNMNGAVARNTGLMNTDGEFISFLDDDDLYYKNRLEKCVKFLNNNQDYGAVYTDVDVFKNDIFIDRRNVEYKGNIWKELLMNEGLLGTGSNIFIRRKCVEDIGFFDSDFIRYQDVEYMIRVSIKYKIGALNEILVRKNIEDTNIPSYVKYKENKELILNKFKFLIDKLPSSDRERFLYNQYRTLFRSAVCSKNRKYISEAIVDYRLINHKMTWKEKLMSIFPYEYIIFSSINFKLRK